MAVAEADGSEGWVWEDTGEDVEAGLVAEMGEGEWVWKETVEVVLPYDVIEHIVARVEESELAWVRGVCRGMREAADRRWRVLRAGKKVPQKMQNSHVPWKGWRGAVQSVGRMEEVPVMSQHWKRVACNRIARYGCLAVLQWARANGCEWDWLTCAWVAQNGDLAMLQWVRANGCGWDEWMCANAARGGHLAVLQWARANGCEWDSETCAEAAGGGHLEVLQWARENGCEWNAWTCAYAARGGHLAVLQWARVNGCEWDSYTCVNAALKKQEHVLEWVHDRPGEEWPCAGEGGASGRGSISWRGGGGGGASNSEE